MRTVLLALTVLCLAGPLEARRPHPPMPKGNPGAWVVTDDYPASALRNGAQGVVHFTLAVGADGVPERCDVTESSGNQALDDAACAALLAKARFVPAIDARGRNIAGKWSNSVRWAIPDDEPDAVMHLPPPGFASTSFIVETDGTISDCRVEKAEGAFAGDHPGDCPAGEKVAPILDANGKAVRKRVRIEMRVVQEDVAP